MVQWINNAKFHKNLKGGMAMHVGVSTACLYPLELEKSLDILQSLGFHTYECFFNTFSELNSAYLQSFQRKLKQFDSHVCSIHPFFSGFESFMLFSEYKRRFWDTLEFYKSFFEAAQFLSAKYCVIHGDKKTVISEEEYFSRFYTMVECGKKFGISVVQENVNLFRSADPGFILRMKKALGKDAKFVLDVKQAVRAGLDPYDVLNAMGENVVHVHISDNLPGKDCLLPGKGQMDFVRLRRRLEELHFQGDFIVELYRHNFHEPSELMEAAKFLEPLLYP